MNARAGTVRCAARVVVGSKGAKAPAAAAVAAAPAASPGKRKPAAAPEDTRKSFASVGVSQRKK